VSDPQPPPPPNVAALVDAIDARAKQAGADGATEVMQRMLGSVSDVLAAISDRLDHVEDLLSPDAAHGGGGADATGLVDAVQAGLASFNARLGRLEEAFVQAVDDSGTGTQSVVDEVRTVVTRALEEAVPAGKKAPTLDPETRDALARVEAALGALADRGSAAQPVEDALALALTAFGERLDALEQRIVATVHAQGPAEAKADLSTLDLTAQLAPIRDRLDDVQRRITESSTQATGTTVEDAFELVQVRIAGLEQLVRTRATERQDSSAEVRAAIAPTMERLQGVETALRASKDQIARVDAAVAAIPGRIASLEERVWAVVSSLSDGTAPSGGGLDPAVLERLEEAVERLDRDEASARLVRLVEERLSAGLRAVTERTDEVRRALEAFVSSAASTASSSSAGAEEVKARVETLTAEVRSLSTVPDAVSTALAARLGPLADRIGGLDARLDGLDAHVSGIVDTVDALHTSLDWVAAMRLKLDEIAARPMPDVGVLSELQSRMDELSSIPARLGELSGALPLLDDLVARPSVADGDGDVKAAVGELRSSIESRLDALAASRSDRDGAASAIAHELGELRSSVGDRLSALEARLDVIAARDDERVDTEAVVRAVRDSVASLDLPAPSSSTMTSAGASDETRAAILALTSSLADRFESVERRIEDLSRPSSTLEDLVRKETELLTQRVAALAVGVEATRVLLEQQHQDSENRIGRKAGEVTRRLAADFGIRTGRSGPGGRGRRDPRELGPPSGDRS
jgi:hypothetical protein